MEHFLVTWMALLFVATVATVGGQPFCRKPAKLLVGLLAGGGLDVLARIVRQRVSEQWGNRSSSTTSRAQAATLHAIWP